MKIIKTKHYATTNTGDNKYLIYLYNGETIISCEDVVGELAKTTAESKLLNENKDIENVENVSLVQFVDDNDMSITQKGTPLLLVFYLDRELLSNPAISAPFVQSINDIIITRDMNASAFFMPTDDIERIECINPQTLSSDQSERVNKLIAGLEKDFQIDSNTPLEI